MDTRNLKDTFTHGRMIDRLEEGRSLARYAQDFGTDRSVDS